MKDPGKQSHEPNPAGWSHLPAQPHVPWASTPRSLPPPLGACALQGLCTWPGPAATQDLGSQLGSLDVNGFCMSRYRACSSTPPRPTYHPCHFRTQQHKPRFKPPICLFSVFIKEVENERKRLGEGDGMTKSVTCLFNFSAPPPYIPWGHRLQSELQIFTNSINRIQIVFRGASTTQTRVSPPCSQPPSAHPPPRHSHMHYIGNYSFPPPQFFLSSR